MNSVQNLYNEISREEDALNAVLDEVPYAGLTNEDRSELEIAKAGLSNAMAALARLADRFKDWTPPESN